MPNFKYKAINQEGKTIESVILATDEQDVMRQLRELEMIPVYVKKQDSKKNTGKLNFRIKDNVLIIFTKQLYTMLKAGVPIVSCLNTIREQAHDENFKAALELISSDIEQGSKLSDALGQYPKIFPPIYLNSIKVGEVSGNLEESLMYLHKFLDDDARMRAEVKKALRYPMFVFIGIIGAFIVFTTTVIPNFIPMFEKQQADLPLPTKILVEIHYLLSNYGLFVMLGTVLLIVAAVLYFRTPQGRFNLDLFSLKIPVIGSFLEKVSISRFAKLFYTMNRTGINITKTFEIIQETLENKVYNREVRLAGERIINGQGIARSLKQSPYFSTLLVEMIAIGEKSGSLDEMLANVSEFYDNEVSETVSNMTSLIEPVVTIVLGGMILLLALAMFMPMWEMLNIVH